MARPREFDRDEALQQALLVFWEKGFAATSTDDLLQAMGIGRQSFYNAFGDKRRVYLEALASYQRQTATRHLGRLNAAPSPLAGIRAMVRGVVSAENRSSDLGCMGVNAVGEFGATDSEVVALRNKTSALLSAHLATALRQGQNFGEIDSELDLGETVNFILVTMMGLQLAARAGASLTDIQRLADFGVDRLKAKWPVAEAGSSLRTPE